MPTRLDGDVQVQRFGFASDENGSRLLFPHAQVHRLDGRSGATTYGAAECTFEGLEGRLDSLRWSAESASIGSAYLRDLDGRFEVSAERIELPRGVLLVRGASSRVELIAPHVTLHEARVAIRGPFTREGGPPAEAAPSPTRRQERLRFLDSLSGRIYITVKVRLDLPVLGVRTLDQQLRIPIQEGSLDFRALDEGLDWLEGAFLDIDAKDDRLRVRWKVPIFGASHDLITWTLDADAATLAAFGRVPVRSLADYTIAAGGTPKDNKRKQASPTDGGRAAAPQAVRSKIVQAFSVEDIDLALSLLAPRSLDAAGGLIAFGGDDQPGLVDLKVKGAIHDRGPGALVGAIGSVDTTIKDVHVGPIGLTADRLHLDGLDQLELAFEGGSPSAITVVAHRVTASNLVLAIGR